jgi:hypothetical protein
MRQLALLVGVPVALWGLLLYPSWRMWGDEAVLQSGVALGLCLVPAIVTLAGIERFAQTHEARALAALAATGIRMAVCMGGGMLLHTTWPDRFPMAFLYWLAFFYLVILGLEVSLIVRRPPAGPETR